MSDYTRKSLAFTNDQDYCDSHKNKHWQAYSSAVAAAYAKELLYTVPQTAVQRIPRANDLINAGKFVPSCCLLLISFSSTTNVSLSY